MCNYARKAVDFSKLSGQKSGVRPRAFRGILPSDGLEWNQLMKTGGTRVANQKQKHCWSRGASFFCRWTSCGPIRRSPGGFLTRLPCRSWPQASASTACCSRCRSGAGPTAMSLSPGSGGSVRPSLPGCAAFPASCWSWTTPSLASSPWWRISSARTWTIWKRPQVWPSSSAAMG